MKKNGKAKANGSIRYPWEKWFHKRRFSIRRGKDYMCQPHSMMVQIRMAAARYGVRVSVFIDEEEIEVLVGGRA